MDTLNVIDIMSMTDDETEREIHHIDINQEIVIPNIEPLSLFSDDDEEDQELDSEGKKSSKLNRQRTSLNQTKAKESDMLLMETSLMFLDHAPMSPPPFSPPPALPLSPNTNIVTTSFNREVGFLSLPLTSTTTAATTEASHSDHQRKHHHRHKHHHKHRHSTAVGRTAPIDERGHYKSSHQQPETEIVLSPSKLGQ